MTASAPNDPLIGAAELASRLGSPDCRVVDCRFQLLDPGAGRRAYRAGHIPGAVYVDLDDDLSRPPGPYEGRHPLPAAEIFRQSLEQLGISNDSFVVAYDDASGAVAARLWWMLRWVGHERAAVLDGGLGAWTAAGLALESRDADPSPGRFTGGDPRDDWIATTRAIAEGRPDERTILDARARQRFVGEKEPIDPVAGHIPGSVNLPFDELLGRDGRLLPRDALRARFDEALARAPGTPVIAMCGSGVTACHLLLGMEAAGLETGKLYVGSWSEWIRDPARPVATVD